MELDALLACYAKVSLFNPQSSRISRRAVGECDSWGIRVRHKYVYYFGVLVNTLSMGLIALCSIRTKQSYNYYIFYQQ